MTLLERWVLPIAAFAAGAITTWVVLHKDEPSSESHADPLPSVERQVNQTPRPNSVAELPIVQHEDAAEDLVEVDVAIQPNTPPVYVELLGPSWRDVSLEDLHWTFARESRHDAWAFEVESGLAQHVEDKDLSNSLVVEHIECREMTCEVAGYLLGNETIHVQELFGDFDRSVWWHEQYSMHSMHGSAGGMKRFLLIITAQSFDNRIRPPRPLN